MNGRGQILTALIAVAAAAGCASYPAVAPQNATSRMELRLRFVPPRLVTLRTEAGDSILLADVVEVRGRLTEQRGDSIEIHAMWVDFSRGPAQRFGSGANATFALAGMELQEVKRETGKTVLLVLVLLAALGGVIKSLNEEPPPPSTPKDQQPK